MKRKLLLFFPSVERGGCEEYALAVGKEAGAHGYAAEVCFPQVERTRSLGDDFRSVGIPVHDWLPPARVPSGCWGSFEEQRQQALALLQRVRPDRVWAVLPWVDSAVGFLAACGEVAARGLCVWQLATESVEIPFLEARAARRSLERGLLWVAVSRHNRAFVAASYGVTPDRIRVVHNGLLGGVPPSGLSREPREAYRAEVREEFGLAHDARLVITVARLCLEQKGHDLLLEAIKRLSHLDRTHFLWVGDGDDRRLLERMVADAGLRGRVLMPGFRWDVARLLSASDLFVLPSNLEGMPFTIYEALAWGCPVVATNVGGNPEFLTHEHDALLIPPRNVDELAGAIERALSDAAMRRRLVSNGYLTASRRSSRAMLSDSYTLLEEASAHCSRMNAAR